MYKMSDSCQIANLSELYEKYFPDITNGIFVEIGAYDGYAWSNTWGLAEAGWSGLYVEPVHELAERCANVHKNNHVVTVEYAVTDFNGPAKLYMGPTIDSPDATVDEATANVGPWDFQYDKRAARDVQAITLDNLLVSFHIPKEFELLVIDVEGNEVHVLNGFTWDKWQPRMIIIEDHDGNGDARKRVNAAAIGEWFSRTDYIRLQHDGTNSVYILKDYL